jgi:hypothetical protein
MGRSTVERFVHAHVVAWESASTSLPTLTSFLRGMKQHAGGVDTRMEAPEIGAPRPEPTAHGIVLAAVLIVGLVAATLWAFTEDTTPTTTSAGVRVGPRDAYNPVTAGEPLPDGFRQLLPRDAIRPIYSPQFVDADDTGWPPDTDVIGGTIDGEAKAYPVSELNGRELLVDELGGEPILVSW